MQAPLAARVAPVAAVQVRAEPIASAVVTFRAAVRVTGVPSEVVPGDSMDPVHAPIVVVDLPACDLAVAASIAAAEAFEVVASVVAVASAVAVEASEVAAAVVAVAAVVAGKRPES